MRGLSHIDRDYRLRAAAQPAAEVAHDLHPAVLEAKKLLSVRGFGAIADAGAGVYPGAAQVAAHVAGGNSHFRIVADALGLSGIGQCIYIEKAAFLRKPHRSSHADAGLAKRS